MGNMTQKYMKIEIALHTENIEGIFGSTSKSSGLLQNIPFATRLFFCHYFISEVLNF